MKYLIIYKNNKIKIYKFSYNSKKLLLNLKMKYVYGLNHKHISFLNLSEVFKKSGLI